MEALRRTEPGSLRDRCANAHEWSRRDAQSQSLLMDDLTVQPVFHAAAGRKSIKEKLGSSEHCRPKQTHRRLFDSPEVERVRKERHNAFMLKILFFNSLKMQHVIGFAPRFHFSRTSLSDVNLAAFESMRRWFCQNALPNPRISEA